MLSANLLMLTSQGLCMFSKRLVSYFQEAPTFKMQQTVERFIPANHRNARVLISRINVSVSAYPGNIQILIAL